MLTRDAVTILFQKRVPVKKSFNEAAEKVKCTGIQEKLVICLVVYITRKQRQNWHKIKCVRFFDWLTYFVIFLLLSMTLKWVEDVTSFLLGSIVGWQEDLSPKK